MTRLFWEVWRVGLTRRDISKTLREDPDSQRLCVHREAFVSPPRAAKVRHRDVVFQISFTLSFRKSIKSNSVWFGSRCLTDRLPRSRVGSSIRKTGKLQSTRFDGLDGRLSVCWTSSVVLLTVTAQGRHEQINAVLSQGV